MPDETYQHHKEQAARRSAAKSKAGRDIRPLPEVVDPARQASCARNLELFCRTYMHHVFNLPWSNDHRIVLDRLQQATLDGGQFAIALPRGTGKTTLVEAAASWALLYGHRHFVVLVGSDESSACEMMDSIKKELETNDLLAEDFPAVCHPIRKLEGIAHRAAGQLLDSKRTHIGWSNNGLVFPTVDGSPASGAVVRVAGLTGRVRGMKAKTAAGQSIRPDLVILDDPQTDESARSPSQCATRERIINGAVLGLAGPGTRISAVMPCTIIAPDDLADRLLNRDRHPEWQGHKGKLMYALPKNQALWDQYAKVREDSLKAGNDGREATDFYRANREAMDAGAEPAWPVRFNSNEISAVQNAMNIKLQDEAAFFSEYQNDPKIERASADAASLEQIMARTNNISVNTVPLGCDHLTAFIDVQGKALMWMVTAWDKTFGGSIVAWGVYPDQGRSRWSLSDIKKTLLMASPGAGLEGSIYSGLTKLTGALAEKEWRREDGAAMRLNRILIDAGWGQSTDTIYKFCRESPHAPILMPSHGRYVGAGSVPWEQFRRQRGELLGNHWLVPPIKTRRAIRHVVIDTNHWKSFVHARLRVTRGDKTALMVNGTKPEDVRLLAEHLTAEYSVQTTGRGRQVDEWKPNPGKPDNHWLDCLVGCAVGASMCGVAPYVAQAVPKPPKEKKPRAAVSYL